MKKIIFCLPGREFSGRFLQCWTELVYACLSNGIQPIMSQHYSPAITSLPDFNSLSTSSGSNIISESINNK